jgi:hypothetical protein
MNAVLVEESSLHKTKPRQQWLTPVILATQEAKSRMITIQRQPGQRIPETLSKNPSQK